MKKAEGPILKLLNSLYKYAVAALFIFIPLYPKFPLFNVPFTYVAIRAEDFFIAATLGLLLLKLIAERRVKLPTITPQIAIFFFVGLVSTISAILVTKNVEPLLVILHFLRRIEYIVVFFLVYFAGRKDKDRFFYLELILLPAIGVFAYGIAQLYFQAPVISTMDSEASKGLALTLRPGVTLSSTFAGHYDLAVYLSMMMIFLSAISASLNSWIKRLPFIAAFSALLWLFMQTGSRISLAGLVVAVILVTMIYRRYLLGFVLLLIIGVGVATSPAILMRFKSILNVFVSQTPTTMIGQVMAQTPTPTPTPTPIPTPTPEELRPIQEDRSTSIRFDVEWPRALRSLYKNPFLGTGYSSLTIATDNDYLRALGETGVLGFLSFIAVLIGLFKALRHRLSHNGFDKVIAVSSLGVFVFFLITAVFLDVFEASKIAILFWAFMGLAISPQKT